MMGNLGKRAVQLIALAAVVAVLAGVGYFVLFHQ